VPVPVHIVSGFLGSGKTTAIRAQLDARAGEKLAIIVNDFGEASLDEAALAESSPFRITNIPGACVCCTAPEGFVQALGAVLEGAPDRLLIEPTGLARPQDLVDTIRRGPHRDALALAPVVVLLDPRKLASADSDERALLDEQVEAADVLVANRTDLCGDDDLERFDAWVEDLWPAPLAIHRTTHGRVPPALFEWPEGEGARLPRVADREREHRHAHSTEGYLARSWVWSPERVFERDRIVAALTAAKVERFKGIFRTREGVFRFDVAGGEHHQEPSSHRRDSRADAIVRDTAASGLERLGEELEAAILSEEELRAQAHQIEVAGIDGTSRIVDRGLLASLPDGIDDVAGIFPKRSGAAARVGRLFEHLGIGGDGYAVVCAADGFASEPVALQALGQGFLLHTLAGEALPEKQGGPFRLLIPEDVPEAPSACANVKAVTRIVLRG
jgi:G3E family GTPase